MYHFILYQSTSKTQSEKDIVEILNKSYSNNLNNKITGVLFYTEDHFLQYIEGDKNNIEQLYSTILKDKRHSSVKLISKGETAQRNFPNWMMGFKYISDKEAENFFPKVLKSSEIDNLFNQSPNYYLEIMKSFYQNEEVDFFKFWNNK